MKEKCILATFLLLVLISLSCASAAEEIQTDANMAVDDNINDEISVAENDVPEDNDPAAEELGETNEVGTLTDLKNDINSAGNYYELTRDYTYNNDTDYNNRYGIQIKMNFVLDGNGHTLNGNNMSVIFWFFKSDSDPNPYNVTIKNINFINSNGNESNSGCALRISRGPINIVNCTFKDCYNNGSGGAIFDYGHSTIENCTFINNYADKGGAIYGNSNINNCIFINNSAKSNGGALQLTRECYLNNSVFYNNTANGSGGAIFGSALKFENSIFEGNIASGNGGAMYLTDNWYTLEVNNCTFKNNVANNDEDYKNPFGGGAIYMSDNKGLVTNSKFINNTGIKGGALYIVTYATVKNATFESNNASDGGAAYIMRGEIFDSTFTNNSATSGGAVSGFICNISSSQFNDNKATDGGAAYLKNGNVNSSKFYNNTATNGGALYVKNGTVNSSKFYNNTATNGGALYVENGTLLNSEFRDNAAEESGGAINIENSLNITNVDFSGNTANDNPNDYESENSEASIKITMDSIITAQSTSYAINAGGDYTATLKDYKGAAISNSALSFTLDGIDLGNITTDDNGLAKITFTPEILKAAEAGKRNLVITYAGDDYYNPSTKTVAISINKETLSTAANAASYVINYGGYYSVTVKDSKGIPFSSKKITFILNGKTIGSATTNAKGVAKIKLTASILKAAKCGTKNLVVKYDGDSLHDSISKTVKITIKKEKTKITAKKKTFKKAVKTKKYTISLKNSKGKAVPKAKMSLKIKGKTYKASTNKKGKATFKIKLAKKGSYPATISFKATACYLKASKKVKITIK